jgi:cell division protein FtsB
MKFFKSRRFRLVVTLVCLIVVVSLSRGLSILWKKKDIVSQRQEALTRLEREQLELKQKLEEAQSPEFIERMARENLGLIKEGETIVLVPRTENSEFNGQTTQEESLSNWKKWWRLFF